MDPLTQGVVGASLSQASSNNKKILLATWCGFLAGLAADLDVFIRSNSDSLLFLEYHRQFTHSLVFIPVGGFLCAIILQSLFGRCWSLSLKQTTFYCILGYATHALIDACTSYGTQLFWPMSDMRVAWNIMPIIDPLYTVLILALVIFAARKKSSTLAKLALVWVLAYPCLGFVQKQRVIQFATDIAAQRGHQPSEILAKPSFGNILLWKVVYEYQQRFYVDGIRVGFDKKVYQGSSIQKFEVTRDMPWLDKSSQQAIDIERFRWFSMGFIALDPGNAFRIVDVRYSQLPHQIKPLWGITLLQSASYDQHAEYTTSRAVDASDREQFLAMLLGDSIE
jgi:inner membrane protein